MPRYLLHHEHGPDECGPCSRPSPATPALRHQPTICSCWFGGHAIWWEVTAASEGDALELLPSYIAQRTMVMPIATVNIP